jgi:obg-like ATPase 1
MPPKKAVKEEKILLGRPGNNLKSGIVRYITLEISATY